MSEQVTDRQGTLTIGRLPVGMIGKRTSGWWGMMMLIIAEGVLFVYLLFSYYYFALHYGRAWVPEPLPAFKWSAPATAILIVSSVAVWVGERGLHKGSRARLLAGLGIGILLGVVFLGFQVKEWMAKDFSLASHSYGSTYFTVTGFHMAHVTAGVLMLLAVTLWAALGYFDRHRGSAVSIAAIYWHFVDLVWLTIFFTFYVTPYLFH